MGHLGSLSLQRRELESVHGKGVQDQAPEFLKTAKMDVDGKGNPPWVEALEAQRYLQRRKREAVSHGQDL